MHHHYFTAELARQHQLALIAEAQHGRQVRAARGPRRSRRWWWGPVFSPRPLRPVLVPTVSGTV